MKKKLTENQVVVDQNLHIVTDNLVSEWGSVPFPQLSVVLVALRFLSLVHQTHHWTTKGDPFYGDHQLFQRLYDAVSDEIDVVAEKVVGVGCTDNVNMTLQTTQLMKFVAGYGMTQTIPQPSELARRSLQAETNFISMVTYLRECLKECNALTVGVDNMLADMLDKHEGHVYLLKQRCA